MPKPDLARTLDEAEWGWLQPHLKRDAVIIVAPGLDLLEVGKLVAADQSGRIREWIGKGLLTKPTSLQVQEWDKFPSKRFMSLVVQPYVLIQELLQH